MLSTARYARKMIAGHNRQSSSDAKKNSLFGLPQGCIENQSLATHPQDVSASKGETNPTVSGDIEATNNIQDVQGQRQQTPEEKKAARSYRWKIIIGLFLPSVLEALDTTIIASALSFIASDFNDLSQLSWIANAFNITACAFIPAFGQLADLFGRHVMLQACLIIILIGSALAAGAQAFVMLLFGRALQGVACAGILVLVRVILADKVSLAENSKNTSIYTVVAGSAYGVGPVVGGYLTEASWRWCFIINAPIGVLGMVVTFWLLRLILVGPKEDTVNAAEKTSKWRKSSFLRKVSQIDVGGQFLFLVGAALFILAITWGGATYPWTSAAVLVPLVVGASLFLLFPVYEYYMAPGKKLAKLFPHQTAMVPFKMLATRNVGLLCYINFATGMAMYGVLFFAGVYFAVVEEFSSSTAGLRLLFYLPGLGVGAYFAMYFCLVRPRNTFLALFSGSVIEAIGITVLISAFHKGNIGVIYGMMGFTGVGTGMRFMPGSLHGVGFFPDAIAPVVSLMEFMMTFGGTIALSLMGSVFNNKMSSSNFAFSLDAHTSSLQSIASLPPEIQAAVRERAGTAVMWAFVAIAPFMWVAVLLAGMLGNVYLDKDGQTIRGEGEGGDAIRSRKGVVEGSYLVDLFQRYSRRGITSK